MIRLVFTFCLKDGYDVIVEGLQHDQFKNGDQSVKKIMVGNIPFLAALAALSLTLVTD